MTLNTQPTKRPTNRPNEPRLNNPTPIPIQADALAPGKNKYAGVLDCFRQTVAEGGPRALFSGLGFTLLRAVPVASVILPTYDFCYYQLSVLWGIERAAGGGE